MTSPLNSDTQREFDFAGSAVCVVLSGAILWHFHDVFWYGPDDGAYAHIAQRILDGEILNRDIQDIHAGYVNFANAFAMWIFGETFVSLRYPLIAMGMCQAVVIYAIMSKLGRLTAVAAALTLSVLSTVQYFNPTAHWYAFFIFIVILFTISRPDLEKRGRLEIVGFLLVTLFLVRQLTGVIGAIAIVSYLIYSLDDRKSSKAVIGRSLLSVMTIGLIGYLWSKGSIAGFLLIGVWPIAVLVRLVLSVRISNRKVLSAIGRLTMGALIGVVPILVYHLAHGSIETWIGDVFLAAINMTQLEFLSNSAYGVMLGFSSLNVFTLKSVPAILNGLFWIALLLSPSALGVLVWKALGNTARTEPPIAPLPFAAVFFAIVSLHFQIPIYIFFAAGITFAALLCLSPPAVSKPARIAAVSISLYVSAVGIVYQAGQPLIRGISGIVQGKTGYARAACPARNCGLQIEASDAKKYREILEIIDTHTRPGDFILAMPVNPEIYVLSQRRNPFRFFSSALGIRTEEQRKQVIDAIRSNPPVLLFYKPGDKYTTPHTRAVMESVESEYRMIRSVDEFEIYKSLRSN